MRHMPILVNSTNLSFDFFFWALDEWAKSICYLWMGRIKIVPLANLVASRLTYSLSLTCRPIG